MILKGTSVRGIYLYADNIEFERGDFVVDSDCLYVCLAENPTNTENNTVLGIKPSEDTSGLNYKIYPGDKISTVDEYYDFVKEGGEDKYISSDTLCKILENSYFGIGENGIIKDFVFYDSLNDRVSYSVKNAKEIIDNYATGGRRILNEILVKDDLNNGTIKISSDLIDLKDLLPDSKEKQVEPKYRPLKMSSAGGMILGVPKPIISDMYQCNDCGHIFEDVYIIEDVRRCPLCGSSNVSPYSEPIRIERIVSGKITAYSTGNGISGATIIFTDADGLTQSGLTLSNGTYSIDISLLTGTVFDVEIHKTGYSTKTVSDVSIPARGKTGLDYTLTETATRTLSGTITGSSGLGISSATISLYKSGALYKSTLTTASGKYSIQVGTDVATTNFSIKIEKTGYQTVEQSITVALTGVTTKNFTMSATPVVQSPVWIDDNCIGCGKCAPDLYNVCSSGCKAIEKSDGKYSILGANNCVSCYACSNICPVDAIKFAIALRTISGTISDTNGDPIPGASVAIKYGGTLVSSTTTSTSGSYKMGISSDQTSFTIEISAIGYITKTDTITVSGSRSNVNYSLSEDIIEEYWTIRVVEKGTTTGISGASIKNNTTQENYPSTTLRGYISLPSSTSISVGDVLSAAATGYSPNNSYTVTIQDVANHSITIGLEKSKTIFQASGVVRVGSTTTAISGAVLYNPTTKSQVTTDTSGAFSGLTCYEDDAVQISATRFITEDSWTMVKGSSNVVSLEPVTINGTVVAPGTVSNIVIKNLNTNESITLSSATDFTLGGQKGIALGDDITCSAAGYISHFEPVTQSILDGSSLIFRLSQERIGVIFTVLDKYTNLPLSGVKVVNTATGDEMTTPENGRISFLLSGEGSGDSFELSLENYITLKTIVGKSTSEVYLSLSARGGVVKDTLNNGLSDVIITNITRPTIPLVHSFTTTGRYLIAAYPGDTLRYEKTGYITKEITAPALSSQFPTVYLSKDFTVAVIDSLTGVALSGISWLDTTTSQTGYTDSSGQFNPPTVPGTVLLTHANYQTTRENITEYTTTIDLEKRISSGIVIDSVTGKGLSATITYKTLKSKSGDDITTTTDQNGKFEIAFYSGEVLVITSSGYTTKEYTITEEQTSSAVIELDKGASTNGGHVYEYYDYQSGNKTPISDARVQISREVGTSAEGKTETYWVNTKEDGSFVFVSTGIEYNDKIEANKANYEGTSRVITAESDPDLDNIILLLKRLSQDWSLCEEGTQTPISKGKIVNETKGITVTDISATGGFTIEAVEGDELSIESDGFETKTLTVTSDLIQNKVIYLSRIPEEFTVKDYLTGKVLEGALAVVNGDLSRSATSGSDGKFRLNIKDKESIGISLSGYDSETLIYSSSVSHTIQLHRKKSSGHVYDQSTSNPLGGVLIESNNSSVASVYTDSSGHFEIPTYDDDVLTFSLSYYQPKSVAAKPATNISVVYLVRQELGGYVKDSLTGKGVYPATVTYGSSSVTTSSDGSFDGLTLIQGALLKVTATDYYETSYTVSDLDNVEIFIEKPRALLKVIDNTTEKSIKDCVIYYKTLRDREGNTITATARETSGLYTITAYSGYEIVVSAEEYEDYSIANAGVLISSWTAETDTNPPTSNIIRLVKGGTSIAVRDSVLNSYLSDATIRDTVHGTQATATTAGHYKLNLYEDSILSIARTGYDGQTVSYRSLVDRGFVVDLVKMKTSGIVVVKGENVPIAGATITNKSVTSLAPVVSSSVGEFSISTWKNNVLTVIASGFKTGSYTIQEENEASVTIELEREEVVEVIISGTIVDQVSGAKVGGAEISINNYSIRTISDSKGYFSISLPTSGTFTFKVAHEDYVDFSSTLNIPSTGKNDILFRITPKVTPDPEPTRVTLTGFVYDNKTSAGIPSAKVLLSREGRGIATVYTDSIGYYEILNVEVPYNYQFDIIKDGYKNYTSTNTITSESNRKLFYIDPEEQIQPDDRPLTQRGSVYILRQYTYVDNVRGDNNRFRIQELVDPYYGDIHFRYARSSEQEGSKKYTYSIVSNWRSVFESSLSILDKLSAINTHYNNKCIELENTKVSLENRFCYRELNLGDYRINDGSISIPYIAFSEEFSTTFPVTFTIKRVIDSANKIYRASSITIDLSDVIDSREETYKIDEDLLITVTYANNSINITATSSQDVIIKSAYYKQNYIPENE